MANERTAFMVIGNKSDHPDRAVQEEEGREFARQRNMLFF